MSKKIVLAYSGGLDTSIIIPWLNENYNYEVIAYAADLGQEEDWDKVQEKAYKSGAAKVIVDDLKEEFIRDYAFPTLRAGALYERQYYLGTAIGRPLIAKKQVELAQAEGATAVCHGCTGKGNDQVRFELTFQALGPELEIIAPWRIWDIASREQAIDYAKTRGIPVEATKEKPYSMDGNLWHISYEGGILEDAKSPARKDMFKWTVDPMDAPDDPAVISIDFEAGIPVGIDGVRLDPVTIIERANDIAAKNGVGRVDIIENRLVGMKSRGVYETPGGTLLFFALRHLESLTLDREVTKFKFLVSDRYAELVYYGQWFTPLKAGLDSFLEDVMRYVTGTVTVQLYKGNLTPLSRYSPYALYDETLATFEAGGDYDQKDSAGFIRLFGLGTQRASNRMLKGND